MARERVQPSHGAPVARTAHAQSPLELAFARISGSIGTSPTEHRFRCRLDKRTPIQAGLGGGSSNAATALFAANELCGRPASNAQLIEWSAALGSVLG